MTPQHVTPAARKKRQWIEQAVESLMNSLGLLPCHIVFREEADAEGGQFGRAIGIHYNYPYPQLDIVLYPLVYKMDQSEVKRTVLHEVLHVALWRLKHFRKESEYVWRELEEETVERMAMFFAELLP